MGNISSNTSSKKDAYGDKAINDSAKKGAYGAKNVHHSAKNPTQNVATENCKAKIKNKTVVYVIGQNKCYELGVNNTYGSGNTIKKLAKVDIDDTIEEIYSGLSHTIFANHSKQMYYAVGSNQFGECGINSAVIGYLTSAKQINHFKKSYQRISNVYANVGSQCTFWETCQDKVYGNGYNQSCQLGIKNQTHIYKPTRINHASVHSIMNIQSAEKFSIALCGFNAILIIEFWWRTLLNNNVLVPFDVINLISTYCIYTKVYSTGLGSGSGHGSNPAWSWKRVVVFKNINIVEIACSKSHSLFLEPNGIVWSCGDNRYSQLGIPDGYYGRPTNYSTPHMIPYFVDENIKINNIQCGWYHNLALSKDNKVYSWGYNNYSQCAHAKNIVDQPLLISNIHFGNVKVKLIKCGAFHSYAMNSRNKHFMWGNNEHQICLISKQRQVLIPTEITEINEQLKSRIKEVYLGVNNTKIIVFNTFLQKQKT